MTWTNQDEQRRLEERENDHNKSQSSVRRLAKFMRVGRKKKPTVADYLQAIEQKLDAMEDQMDRMEQKEESK